MRTTWSNPTSDGGLGAWGRARDPVSLSDGSTAGTLTQQLPVVEEVHPEHFRDGEDPLGVAHVCHAPDASIPSIWSH